MRKNQLLTIRKLSERTYEHTTCIVISDGGDHLEDSNALLLRDDSVFGNISALADLYFFDLSDGTSPVANWAPDCGYQTSMISSANTFGIQLDDQLRAREKDEFFLWWMGVIVGLTAIITIIVAPKSTKA